MHEGLYDLACMRLYTAEHPRTHPDILLQKLFGRFGKLKILYLHDRNKSTILYTYTI